MHESAPPACAPCLLWMVVGCEGDVGSARKRVSLCVRGHRCVAQSAAWPSPFCGQLPCSLVEWMDGRLICSRGACSATGDSLGGYWWCLRLLLMHAVALCE